MYMILSNSGFREIEDQFIFQGAKCPRDSLLQDTIKRRTPRIGPCYLYPLYLPLCSLRKSLSAGPKNVRLTESSLGSVSLFIRQARNVLKSPRYIFFHDFLLLSIISCFFIMTSLTRLLLICYVEVENCGQVR